MSVKVAIPRDIESSFDSSIAMPDAVTGEQEWEEEQVRVFRSPLIPLPDVPWLVDCLFVSRESIYLTLSNPSDGVYILSKHSQGGDHLGSVNIPIPSQSENLRSNACAVYLAGELGFCFVSSATKPNEASPWYFTAHKINTSLMTVDSSSQVKTGAAYDNSSSIGVFDIKALGETFIFTRYNSGEENEIAIIENGIVLNRTPSTRSIYKSCVADGKIYSISRAAINGLDFFDVFELNFELKIVRSFRLSNINYNNPKFIQPTINTDGRSITHSVRETVSGSGFVNAQVYDLNMINIGSYKKENEVIKSSTKRKYRCAVDATFDDPEIGVKLSPPTWTDIGSTNRFAVLDSNTSQRSIFNSGGFVSCSITSPVDTVGVFGLSGVQSATVSVISGSSTLYTETKSGMDSEFSDVEIRDLVFGIPPFGNVTIRVNFTGSNVRIGRFAAGVSEAIGRAVPGTELGDIDYSILEFDEFGNTRYVPRPIVSFHTFQVDVDKQKSLSVARKLQSIGGKDAMWSADVGLSEPLVAIGKCERFPITYDNPTIVSYTVKVRGTA